MMLSCLPTRPISSLRSTGNCWLKSPCAIWSLTRAMSDRGRVTCRRSVQAIRPPNSARPSRPTPASASSGWSQKVVGVSARKLMTSTPLMGCASGTPWHCTQRTWLAMRCDTSSEGAEAGSSRQVAVWAEGRWHGSWPHSPVAVVPMVAGSEAKRTWPSRLSSRTCVMPLACPSVSTMCCRPGRSRCNMALYRLASKVAISRVAASSCSWRMDVRPRCSEMALSARHDTARAARSPAVSLRFRELDSQWVTAWTMIRVWAWAAVAVGCQGAAWEAVGKVAPPDRGRRSG